MSQFLTIPRALAHRWRSERLSCLRPAPTAGCRAAPDLAITGGAAAPGSAQDFMVNVGDRVFFDHRLDRPHPGGGRHARPAGAVAAALFAATRSSSKAMPTSAARANTTSPSAPGAPPSSASYLIAHGIAPNRMRTISYGKERPVAVCDDISCWSQNRRAVTVITNAGV